MQAVILLSGGMDSTIALFAALHQLPVEKIDALIFHYGQSHKNEILNAHAVWNLAANDKVKGYKINNFRIVKLNDVFIDESSILNKKPISKYDNVKEALKHNTTDSSYVAARNSVFLSIAANHLLVKSPKGGWLVTGFRGRAEGPNGGFPDGSPEFAEAMSRALAIGAFGLPIDPFKQGRRIDVWDPLNRPGRSRYDALEMAEKLPGCWEALGWSLTCFEGTEPPCGKCLPCLRRAEGFEQYGKPDPLFARINMMQLSGELNDN